MSIRVSFLYALYSVFSWLLTGEQSQNTWEKKKEIYMVLYEVTFLGCKKKDAFVSQKNFCKRPFYGRSKYQDMMDQCAMPINADQCAIKESKVLITWSADIDSHWSSLHIYPSCPKICCLWMHERSRYPNGLCLYFCPTIERLLVCLMSIKSLCKDSGK